MHLSSYWQKEKAQEISYNNLQHALVCHCSFIQSCQLMQYYSLPVTYLDLAHLTNGFNCINMTKVQCLAFAIPFIVLYTTQRSTFRQKSASPAVNSTLKLMSLLIVQRTVLELFSVHILHEKFSVLISPKTIQINKNAGNRFSLTTGK